MSADPTPSVLVFILSVVVLLGTGWALIAAGKRFERWTHWTAISAIVLNLLAGIWSVWQLVVEGGTLEWKRNWIFLSQEMGSVRVGMAMDFPAVLILGVTWLLVCGLVMFTSAVASEQRLERVYGGALLSLAGAEISAIAGTPWFALFGLSFTVLGGYFSVSTRSSVDSEARLSVRYVWERGAGLALIIAGLCGRLSPSAPELGNWLFLVGILIQFHPFPLTGWLVGSSDAPAPNRIIPAQTLPALAAFTMLFRMESALQGGTELTILPWLFLGAAFFNAVSGLVQTAWKSGFSAWTSAALCLPAAALAMGYRAEALLLLSSLVPAIGAMVLGMVALTHSTQEGNANKGTWTIVFLVIATAVATGAPGFGSAGGFSGWWNGRIGNLAEIIPIVAAVFFIGFTAWKLTWDLFPLKAPLSLPWYAVMVPVVLILPSLGVVWAGNFSGGLFGENADFLWKGLVHLAVPATAAQASATDLGVFPSGSIILISTFAVQIGLAAWLAPKITAFERTEGTTFLNFLSSGFKTDQLGSIIVDGTIRGVSRVNEALDQGLWREGSRVSKKISQIIHATSRAVHSVDQGVASGFVAFPRGVMRVAGDLLQRLLVGDVQAYVLFIVATVFVLLIRVTIQ